MFGDLLLGLSNTNTSLGALPVSPPDAISSRLLNASKPASCEAVSVTAPESPAVTSDFDATFSAIGASASPIGICESSATEILTVLFLGKGTTSTVKPMLLAKSAAMASNPSASPKTITTSSPFIALW